MAFLVRKFNKAKWLQTDLNATSDVGADAVTGCLNTRGNSLSVWQIDDETPANLDTAVLAIVSKHTHLATFDVVILDEAVLTNHDILIEENPGDTPVDSLKHRHRDISNLTFSSLGHLKDAIIDKLRSESTVRITVGHLKRIINQAVADDLLIASDLSPSIQSKL